ncbi:hypothetical protein KOR34_35940 [Posidoniimonas corsicana]|uniref:N-acyl amino acid synthase FeeM catalytic core domain-containing protein n=1 Tax=Posidoniimonas corsicana TaxID=1938618 RepID=A0A5C5V6M3_9BACT|nr:long-chain N-acyl amino acid synthase [Posidoniimonas corsicana]TWT33760.1 hypothetical protein KOR34_35940 [Posidoniimonas corsicana]
MNTVDAESLTFSKCDNISLQLARTTDDYLGAFTLVHDSYVRADLSDPHPMGLRIMPHQLLDTSQVFVAKYDERVISTQTVVVDSPLGLPMESIYPDVIGRHRASGRRLAEVCCLADRRLSPKRFFDLFSELSRLMAQFALRHGVDDLWIACHPRHAKLYERRMGFQLMGDERDHPLVKGNPAVPLRVDLINLREEYPKVWTQFFSEPISEPALAPTPHPEADWEYFQRIAEGCVGEFAESSPHVAA